MKEKLKELISNSYAPYSKMHFACIVEAQNGNLYSGVNVENASYGGSICAERNAINAAVGDGQTEFKAVYLMTDSDSICYPCDICKQTFLEFFDKNVIFNIMTMKGEMRVLTFDEVLNTRFVKGDLR